MQIDLRTVTIKPLRQTFDHLAKRFGDKPATRYQEGTYDLQATHNFHYRPTWDPDHELFDKSRTQLQMRDWYDLKDPRQFYYGTYTLARARQQEAAEANFDYVETRNLLAQLPDDVRQSVLDVMLPLRHVAWGGNMNNAYVCAYGYGTAITQPCIYQAMDQLGIAQYITRMGLLLAEPEALEAARHAWVHAPMWQELRRYLENSFVMKDWFELYIAQNLVIDGLLYPLIYQAYDDHISQRGGIVINMLCRFMTDWFAETSKWVDAQIKVAAAESPENKELITQWIRTHRDQVLSALRPLASHALNSKADDALQDLNDQFVARVAKLGITL